MQSKIKDLESRIALHERLLLNPKLGTTPRLNIQDNLDRLKKELEAIKKEAR